ncbi:hypothetical protein AGMMS50239_03490 [Bacteroidia bacterium]|nr:hypothetical protein AGMMS50239_03490 [Bacteroidia bacterium]
MGYIKEPEGIDFIIKSKPLTVEEDKSISEYIKTDKAKNRRYTVVRKTAMRPVQYV